MPPYGIVTLPAAWKFSLGDKVTVLCNVQDADENDVQEWFEGVVVDQKRAQ